VTGEFSATIGAVPMLAGEQVSVGLRFEGPAGLAFELAVRERIGGITTGGVGYQWIIPDTTPPKVLQTYPGQGATWVPLDAPITILFSEPMAAPSLDLVLEPDPGGWSITWNEAGTVVTATHAGLAGGVVHAATVAANDVAGNALVSPYTWSFRASGGEHRVYLPIIPKR
jgi:hypothetical protein